jgi:hypothetical protein
MSLGYEDFYIAAIIHCGGIDQRQYPRTHCNYKEYMDNEFMSSDLLKNFVYSGCKPNMITAGIDFLKHTYLDREGQYVAKIQKGLIISLAGTH